MHHPFQSIQIAEVGEYFFPLCAPRRSKAHEVEARWNALITFIIMFIIRWMHFVGTSSNFLTMTLSGFFCNLHTWRAIKICSKRNFLQVQIFMKIRKIIYGNYSFFWLGLFLFLWNFYYLENRVYKKHKKTLKKEKCSYFFLCFLWGWLTTLELKNGIVSQRTYKKTVQIMNANLVEKMKFVSFTDTIILSSRNFFIGSTMVDTITPAFTKILFSTFYIESLTTVLTVVNVQWHGCRSGVKWVILWKMRCIPITYVHSPWTLIFYPTFINLSFTLDGNFLNICPILKNILMVNY